MAFVASTAAPFIAIQPRDWTAGAGSSAAFFVTATGTAPLSYRWRHDGTNLVSGGRISGTDSSLLAISNVQDSDIGNYVVVVTNAYGAVTSRVAALTAPLRFTTSGSGLSVTNSMLRLKLTGTPGAQIVLEASEDLHTWRPLQTNVMPAAGLDLSFPLGTNRSRFFRGRNRP
ncbi:MAG: immunoglobulin domain-containing protein [Verrucomicrobia bacterium]|nr:immunoglobulin domain-containing protein [Verrucomicrobiota bacterium]